MKLRKIIRRRLRSSDYAKLGRFTFMFVESGKEMYNLRYARAQLLFCSLRRNLVGNSAISVFSILKLFRLYFIEAKDINNYLK